MIKLKTLLNEQIAKPIDLEKILVKNFYKFKFPTRLDDIEKNWMTDFGGVDGHLQSVGTNLDTTKDEYMSWLQKNGFQRGDIYVSDDIAGRVQKQIIAKRFK